MRPLERLLALEDSDTAARRLELASLPSPASLDDVDGEAAPEWAGRCSRSRCATTVRFFAGPPGSSPTKRATCRSVLLVLDLDSYRPRDNHAAPPPSAARPPAPADH